MAQDKFQEYLTNEFSLAYKITYSRHGQASVAISAKFIISKLVEFKGATTNLLATEAEAQGFFLVCLFFYFGCNFSN